MFMLVPSIHQLIEQEKKALEKVSLDLNESKLVEIVLTKSDLKSFIINLTWENFLILISIIDVIVHGNN